MFGISFTVLFWDFLHGLFFVCVGVFEDDESHHFSGFPGVSSLPPGVFPNDEGMPVKPSSACNPTRTTRTSLWWAR